MTYVSDEADAKTWTCEIRLRDGRLPDIADLERHLAAWRVGATLRGVEATVDGELIKERGELQLKVSKTDERLRLVPLTRKVQWDADAEREQPPTDSEREAFARLRDLWGRQPKAIRVIGPVTRDPKNGSYILEVRMFHLR